MGMGCIRNLCIVPVEEVLKLADMGNVIVLISSLCFIGVPYIITNCLFCIAITGNSHGTILIILDTTDKLSEKHALI